MHFRSGQQPWLKRRPNGRVSSLETPVEIRDRICCLLLAGWLTGWLAGGSEMWIRPRPGNQFSAGCIEFFHLAVSEFSRPQVFRKPAVQGERFTAKNLTKIQNPTDCEPAFSYENISINGRLCLLCCLGAIKNGNIKKQVQSRSEKQVQRAMTLHDFGFRGSEGVGS